MKTHVEEVLKASHSANLLVSDIRQAHKAAIPESPLLEVVILDLLTQSIEMDRRAQGHRQSPEAILIVDPADSAGGEAVRRRRNLRSAQPVEFVP